MDLHLLLLKQLLINWAAVAQVVRPFVQSYRKVSRPIPLHVEVAPYGRQACLHFRYATIANG